MTAEIHSQLFSGVGSQSLTLVDLLRERAFEQPARRAYTFLLDGEAAEVELSYGELDRQARAIAAGLRPLVEPGDRVLLLYPPGLDYIAAFFGCLYAGAIAVPAYPPRRNRNLLRLQAIVADAQAFVALTTAPVLARMAPLFSQNPYLEPLRWLTSDSLAPGVEEDWQPPALVPDALAFLQYTSGSTSTPKGVMLSHRNLLHNEQVIQHAFEQTEDSLIVGWLPLYHDMGLIGNVLQPLYVGAPCVLMSPTSFLQRPLRWLRAISNYRATTSGGPNFAYDLCLRKIDDEQKQSLDLSSWSVAFNGAEPIRHETLEQFAAAFAPCGFRREAFQPCYGLAESTLIVSGGLKSRGALVKRVRASELEKNRAREIAAGEPDGRAIVGCGGALLDHRIVVVEPESSIPCAPDEVGEIWVAGQSVAHGYWNQPEETARTFEARLGGSGEGPFLRTGDLGFIQNGELFVTGRLKDLIVIRGLNHYPQDIELTVERCHAALRPGCGAAFSVEAAGEERLVVVQEFDQRLSADPQACFELIAEAIYEDHDVQVHAIALIRPGSLPKTSSGKIQRGASRAAFLEKSLDALAEWRREEIAPEGVTQPAAPSGAFQSESQLQSWLRSLLAARLGVEAARIDDGRPVSRYGLDSLAAIELTHAIEAGLGIALPMATILQGPSVSELTNMLWERLPGGVVPAGPIAAPAPAAEHPLSHGQQSLWFLHQVAPESAAYNIATALRILSPLDTAALRTVFHLLVARHPALRTVFPSVDGRPVQLVREPAEVSFQEEDMTGASEASWRKRLIELAQRPFDLEQGPLMRVGLFTLSEQEHVLVLAVHHIVADFWSLAVLMEELGALYEAERTGATLALAAPALRYTDYVLWQEKLLEGAEGERLWSYWREQLGGELPVLNLPTDLPRAPVPTSRGAAQSFRLDAGVTSKLKALGQDYGATLYMTLLAAFAVLLHRYTGQDDILVGSPTAGRNWGELGRVVGYFVNPVVLRTRLDGGETFGSLLGRVRLSVLEAFKHQDYPFDMLVERLQPERDPSRSPLFQVMFTLQKAHLLDRQGLSLFALNEDGARMNLGGLRLESIALEQRAAQFDLALAMTEVDGELSASLEYNTDLFEATTVARMREHFQRVLEAVAADPEQRLGRIPILSASERRQLLVEWNSPGAMRAQPSCVHQLFERQVARTPDAVAVSCEGLRLSYAELNSRANQLARHLQSIGVAPERRVGLCVERSPDMIVGLLGILKAGGVYVPLDPQYPVERLQFILEDAGASVLLTQARIAGSLPALAQLRVVRLDDDRADISRQAAHDMPGAVLPANLAYVIYTSGSTGRPKGVGVSHEAAAAHFNAMQEEYELRAEDRVLQFASMSFDVSLEQILPPLLLGARVVLRGESVWSAAEFAQKLKDEGLTVVNFPTAYWHQLTRECAESGEPQTAHPLRLAIIGGDTISPEAVRLWQFTPMKTVRLLNAYGPTEATITATTFEIPPDFCDETTVRKVPIGRAVSQRAIYILDREGNPSPTGVAGELCIGGALLARGYLNWPELTAEKFVPDPFGGEPGARLYRTGDSARFLDDGRIEFLGRSDNQAKVRGFRIELGEIEATLSRHPAARGAAVLVQEDSGGRKQLVAYVAVGDEERVTPAGWRRYSQEWLPDYMIPAEFVMLDELPLTPNGKVDRRALPALAPAVREAADDSPPPRNAAEEVLAGIWSEVLGVERVGVNDNFFSLGGDSILSIQVVARARRAGFKLIAQQLFQHQTIADLATVCGTALAPVDDRTPVAGAVALTPIQRWFFEQNFSEPQHYNQAVLLEVEPTADVALLEKAVQHLLVHHDALRLRFVEGLSGWEQHHAAPSANGLTMTLFDLSAQACAEQAASIEDESRRLQQSLNLSEGPLVATAYFHLGDERRGLLLLAIHHLAVDGVSWRVLLEDLELAYMQLSRGEVVELPPKTASFQQWATRLRESADTAAWRHELDYWQNSLGTQPTRLPLDYPGGENTEATARAVSRSLDASETRVLLQEIPSLYRTRINDVLLTALVRSFACWTGGRSLLIDLEGHGREELEEELDVSRTVGWFTSVYPVRLELEPGLSSAEALKSIKGQLRQIPGKGIGYGLLRYLSTDAAARETLRRLPRAEVSFNYLGQFDQLFAASRLFKPARESAGSSRAGSSERSHLINVEARIVEGRLQFEWIYGERLHRRPTVERLADDYLSALRSLLGQGGQAGPQVELIPSDFPLANLNEQQFSKLTALLGGKDK
ncbi:MAG: amino acid adenylation domain-containing protein [Acidobacteria bacterium]|nr:amino acid adenylation domain-containing protein [Acidobacteriota bacterium]